MEVGTGPGEQGLLQNFLDVDFVIDLVPSHEDLQPLAIRSDGRPSHHCPSHNSTKVLALEMFSDKMQLFWRL